MNYHSGLTGLNDHELLSKFFSYQFKSNKKHRLELEALFWGAFPTLADYKNAHEWQKSKFMEDIDQSFVQLMVGIEIGQRIAKTSRPLMGKVFSSRQVGENLISEFRNDQQENLCLICLDVKHRILSQQVVFKGTLTTCPVHPREIFALALEQHAESILVAHNHPSGVVEPSKNDIAFTKRLNQCGQLLGINLLDSFIIGQRDYLSLREANLIDAVS
ncbi:RadC family protein [Paucilactobacillus kaifaensis]|uniref:RadC family protein n=1 Tax=Paucilactobacillus kaifaensis TaxID=2559921 RepID=UPI0010F52BAD|nr:DNA repair protein RadC [Paucilactobacillus kaifaensis]